MSTSSAVGGEREFLYITGMLPGLHGVEGLGYRPERMTRFALPEINRSIVFLRQFHGITRSLKTYH